MLEAVLNKEIIVNKTLCRIIGVLAFIILTALGAFVRIPLPFSPVPITLQTFFVLLSGAFLGSNLGAITQLSYISLGVLGLPVFTGAGSGLLYLFGPTGGYLVGFVFASFLIGRCIRYNENNFLFILALFCLGDLILLCTGVIWLKVIFGYNLKKLLFVGFIPFIGGDILKAGFASSLYLRAKSRLKEIF
jgi:biotin transport system substrate-specific component